MNPYYTIVKNNNTNEYIFGELSVVNDQQSVTFSFEENQERAFSSMLSGDGYSRDELVNIFGSDVTAIWLKNKILLPMKPDSESIYSRNLSFYFHNDYGDVQSVLNSKKALILGCGGIGAHVAWNLAALGVGELDLLDFDIVEASNLNRQILFDHKDIGKYKAQVLKDKLSLVNPYIKISEINARISSEESLEAVCLNKNYDLVIKTLDSPPISSLWVDRVCKRLEIPYIFSIMMTSLQAIGPTYIPGESAGYEEFFNSNEGYDRIAGVAPSTGFIVYQIGGEVTAEAFKLLTGKGELKYLDKVLFRDCMDNHEFAIRPKNRKRRTSKRYNPYNFIIIISIFFLANVFNLNPIFATAPAMSYAILSPLFLYDRKKDVLVTGFINVLLTQLLNILSIIGNGVPESLRASLPDLSDAGIAISIVSALFAFISVALLFAITIQTALWILFKRKRGRNIRIE